MKRIILTFILLMIVFLFCEELVLIPTCVDISVINIFLDNEESSRQILGDSISICELAQFDYDEYAIMPHISYYNKNKKQILTLIFHPGCNKNSFNEIVVRDSIKSSGETIYHLDTINSFITGKKIEIGLTKRNVLEILGSNFKTELMDRNVEIIEYRIGDFEKSDFLKEYNFPEYYGKYKFINNILVEFSFGFIYP